MQNILFNYRQSNLTLLTLSRFPYMWRWRESEFIKKLLNALNNSDSCNPKKIHDKLFLIDFKVHSISNKSLHFVSCRLKNLFPHEVLLNKCIKEEEKRELQQVIPVFCVCKLLWLEANHN